MNHKEALKSIGKKWDLANSESFTPLRVMGKLTILLFLIVFYLSFRLEKKEEN